MNIEEVWENYSSSLDRFLHSKVSNAADVEDLQQEILIKTYKNLLTLKEHKSVKAWLFQIANNVIIDFYRKKGRTQELEAEELWFLDERNEVRAELSECIAPFIQALPKEHADLLEAIDIQGRSQKEYAEELGIGYSTLKSRVQKSRALLREVFDECCYFQIDQHGRVYGYELKEGEDRCEKKGAGLN